MRDLGQLLAGQVTLQPSAAPARVTPPGNPFTTAPICSHYRGPHREWPVALKLEPIGKPQ
jgi:hypothetical protein